MLLVEEDADSLNLASAPQAPFDWPPVMRRNAPRLWAADNLNQFESSSI